MIYRLDKCILTDVVCGYQQMKTAPLLKILRQPKISQSGLQLKLG